MNKLEVGDQKHYQSNYFDIEFIGKADLDFFLTGDLKTLSFNLKLNSFKASQTETPIISGSLCKFFKS